MTVIIDYGVGNLFSLKSSLASLGENAIVSGDPNTILSADRIILPGVGAFEDAANKLREHGLDAVIKKAVSYGTPLLGICLGMQMLFDKSYEFGEHEGLGLIPGSVTPFAEKVKPLKVPQIGWNRLTFPKGKEKSRLFKYLNEGDYVYFVHSYSAVGCDEYVSSVTDYGAILTASAENGCVYGVQFHPEKSGGVGLSILRAFLELENERL